MARRPGTIFFPAGLALGLAIGWLAHRPPAPVPPIRSVPAAAALPPSAAPADRAVATNPDADLQAVRAAPPDVGKQRLDAVVWLQQQGILPPIAVMLADGQLNPALAQLLDLTAGETNRLNAALRDADTRLKALASRQATGQLAADGSRLTVRVPSLPTEGGAIYNDTLQQFAAVLGPDRQSAFEAIAGTSLERAFDNFALNPVTYELTLTPLNPAATDRPIYEIKRSFSAADGSGSGWSESKLAADDIPKFHPVLAQFIRPEMLKTTPAPHP